MQNEVDCFVTVRNRLLTHLKHLFNLLLCTKTITVGFFFLLIKLLGCRKKFASIFKKNWRALNFRIHLLNYMDVILFYNRSPSFCQFENFVLQGFCRKTFLRDFFISTKEMNFLPLREFCNDQNGQKSEGTRSGENGRSDKEPQKSSVNFCRVIRDTWHPRNVLLKHDVSTGVSPGRFCSIAVCLSFL